MLSEKAGLDVSTPTGAEWLRNDIEKVTGETWDQTGSVWSAGSKKTSNSEAIIIEEGESAQYNTHENTDVPFKLKPGKYAIKFDLKNSRLTITRRSN